MPSRESHNREADVRHVARARETGSGELHAFTPNLA